jgi:hypothetical protein
VNVRQAAGMGLVAGVVGTVALTLAEKAEMALSGRKPSTFAGQVGAKLCGRDPEAHPQLVGHLNPLVHWTHGIALGPIRGLLGLAGLSPPAATLAFYAVVWGGDAALYRMLDLAPSPWRWQPSELATDLFDKGALAAGTSVAYVVLEALRR